MDIVIALADRLYLDIKHVPFEGNTTLNKTGPRNIDITILIIIIINCILILTALKIAASKVLSTLEFSDLQTLLRCIFLILYLSQGNVVSPRVNYCWFRISDMRIFMYSPCHEGIMHTFQISKLSLGSDTVYQLIAFSQKFSKLLCSIGFVASSIEIHLQHLQESLHFLTLVIYAY